MRRCTGQILLLALFIAALVSLSFAQKTLKIGVVDSQEVLQRSAEGKRALARLQEKDAQSQTRIAKLDEEIRELEKKLSTQRLTLTNEARINLNADIQKTRTERNRVYEDETRELQNLQIRLFNKLQEELLPIIEKIGKEMDYDIILDKENSGAIYFNPTIDLTEEVIKRYDASRASK